MICLSGLAGILLARVAKTVFLTGTVLYFFWSFFFNSFNFPLEWSVAFCFGLRFVIKNLQVFLSFYPKEKENQKTMENIRIRMSFYQEDWSVLKWFKREAPGLYSLLDTCLLHLSNLCDCETLFPVNANRPWWWDTRQLCQECWL